MAKMSELNYPHTSDKWALEKGIKRKCSKHNITYDPHIGCKKCEKEEEERRLRLKAEEERKRKLRGIFDNVIWPNRTKE